MISFSKPSATTMESILASARQSELSYPFEGCTEESTTPRGYNRDASRVVLGTGKSMWISAVEAFKQWQFMPASMVEVIAQPAIEAGQIVGVLFRGVGVWAFNPCRILKLHNESNELKTEFGFTYGTLPGHVEKGEERFLLTWDRATDEVCYEIEAVSCPNHWMVWTVYPYARMQQARFRVESGKSMQAAVV